MQLCFTLTVIPWGNDSGFTFQQGKPSLRANEITGLKSHRFEWGRASSQLCMALGFGNSCSAWLCWLLPFENEKQRSKIQFPQYAGGLWDASRGKLFLLSFYKCPTLRIFLSFFFFLNVLLPSSLTWYNIFLGSRGGAKSLMEVPGVATPIYLHAPGIENLFMMAGLGKI